MKRFLLATVATAGIALATPAFAQTTTPVPAEPPPIVAQAPDTGETPAETAAPTVTPEAAPATVTEALPAPTPQAEVAMPETSPAPQTAEAPRAGAVAAAPTETQTAAAPPTDAQAAADVQSPAPALQAETNEAIAVPASASDVCAARTTSVHFGARGSALSRENQNAIQYATDAASACSVQTVTIVDSAEGRAHSRRAEAVRSTLVRQGVPEERITIAQDVNADPEAASTGRLDVRMQFAGVANQAALEPQSTSGANAAAAPTLQGTENVVPAPAPQIAPTPAPEAAPAPGVEELAQPATPPVEMPEQQPGT